MRTSYAAYQDIRHHYEDADFPAECGPYRERPRCLKCGGFLPISADTALLDMDRELYMEVRRCKKCGKVSQCVF